MDRTWVKIVSWHILKMAPSAGPARALCGRVVPSSAEASPTLPGGKSCESCLRISARQDDR